MGSQKDQPRRRGRPPKPLHADGSSAARLGFEIRRRRERSGLTQAALGAIIGFSPQHLSSVERGETPVSEPFVQACDDALGADGCLLELLPPVVYERARSRWSNRMERDADSMLLPPSKASLPVFGRAPTESAGSARIAAANVEAIGAMVTALRRVDNRHGGGSTRGVVLGYLNREVSPMLRAMQARGAASRRLMQVAAELTQLAGWVSHETACNPLGRGRVGVGGRGNGGAWPCPAAGRSRVSASALLVDRCK
jgi:transcriptional regulator with XRE-family HTH domain